MSKANALLNDRLKDVLHACLQIDESRYAWTFEISNDNNVLNITVYRKGGSAQPAYRARTEFTDADVMEDLKESAEVMAVFAKKATAENSD